MSQHSHPRSQRGSVGKSPSCQEEEENALQERPPSSALDELQRQVEEELRSSDQVLSRIGSKYSPRASSPPAADRSHHDSFVEDLQVNNYQSTPRTPVSNRSRRDSPVTHSGIVFETPDNFNETSVIQDSNFMEPPVEESCERDNQFPAPSAEEAYYNSVLNETAADTDIPDSYDLEGSPAADTSGFRSSLDRMQSTPAQRVNESCDIIASGQSRMLDNQNLTALSSTKNSASRSSPVMGSAGKNSLGMGPGSMGPANMSSTSSRRDFTGMSSAAMGSAAMGSAAMGSAAMGSAAMGSAIRTPSSKVSCKESNCERISQGHWSNARSATRPVRVDPEGEYMQSQGLIEGNNDSVNSKYSDFFEDSPRSQGASSRRIGEAEADQTNLISLNGSPEAMSSSYQKPPSLEAAFGCQSYQRPQNPEAEVESVPCWRAQTSRAGLGGQLCASAQSPRAGARCQPYQKAPSLGQGAVSQPCQVAQSPRDNCYSRTASPEEADQTFHSSRNGMPGAMSSCYQRPQNNQVTFGNQSQTPVGFRAEAGGQFCQTQEVPRSQGQMYQTAPNLQTKGGIILYQKNPGLSAGGGGQPCQTWSSSPAEVWDDLNLRAPRAEGRRANAFFQGNLTPIPEVCNPFEKSSGTEMLLENQVCQNEGNFREEAGAQQYQRATSPVPQASAVGNPCHLPGAVKMAAGGQQYQRAQSPMAQTVGQPCQSPRSPRTGTEDQQYQRGYSPEAQPCQYPRSSGMRVEDQHYQRAQSPMQQIQSQTGAQPCQSPRIPRAEAGAQQFQRVQGPMRQMQAEVQPCPSSRSPRVEAGIQQYQRARSPMPQIQSQTVAQPCQSPRSPRTEAGVQQNQRVQGPMGQMQGEVQPCQSPESLREAAGGQQYQRAQSPGVQMQVQTGNQPCQSQGSPRLAIGVQPCQEGNSMAEPWDNFYLHPPSPVAGATAEGKRFAAQPDSGAKGGCQPYQRTPKLPSSMALAGNHLHHAEHGMGHEQMESGRHDHHDHSIRSHPPSEKRSQALYRLSQLKKTPSLSQCRIDKDLDFLNACCPKAKTSEKVVKIPERPCLKRQEIETLVRCESRDVEDALFVSGDVSTTYKKPCPKQQKAQMSVQALVQAYAKHPCQPTYSPLEHPDPEDITPKLAAAMMFSQEQGLKMEECPYDIIAHLYPEAPEVPFPRKARQSNVSVVDSQKEQDEIIEKSASVPSEGVSDSVFFRKMKERGEEIEARSSYDVEFAIGQTKRQYVLVTQKPDRVNKVQFRGGSSPLWFPGYFSAFPDEPGLNLVPSPSEVFQKAWVHSNPKNMPTNDLVVLD